MMWAVAGGLYAAGAFATFVFNRNLIVGPVTYPLAVLRNALFWPIFLPWLIAISKER